MFGIGQRAVEDLDDLRRAELPRVVFDLGRAVARAGLVAVDTEHAHQLALDCLAQGSLAAERRVVELDGADAVACHPPAGHPPRIAVVTNHPVLVTSRDRRRHFQLVGAPRQCHYIRRCSDDPSV